MVDQNLVWVCYMSLADVFIMLTVVRIVGSAGTHLLRRVKTMDREVSFRGKRVDSGEWVYGAYCKHDTVKICFSTDDAKNKHLIIVDGFCDWGFEPPLTGYEVIPETVGQYTGLTDKHGVKIFEGDIVKLDKDVKQAFEVDDGVVKFGRGGFYVDEFGLRNSLNTLASYDWVLRGEVIGNVHDRGV